MSTSRAERLVQLEKERSLFRSNSTCLSESTPKIRNTGARHQFTLGSDAFSRATEKEERAVLKYHGKDKTLIVMLEEEKHKYKVLEQEYQSLLGIIQHDNSKHSKQMTNKQAECTLLQQNLSDLLSKYKERVASFNSDSQRADLHFTKMQELFKESESMVLKQESRLAMLEQRNRELQQVAGGSEEKIISLVDSNHKKELALVSQKEEMMKLSVSTLQQSHALSQREQIVKQYSAQLEKQSAEVVELSGLKPALLDARQHLQTATIQLEVTRRDLDSTKSALVQAQTQLEEANSQHRKLQYEVQRLDQTSTQASQELARTRADLESKRIEYNTTFQKHTLVSSDLEDSRANAAQLASTLFTREKEMVGLRDALDESRHEAAQTQSSKSALTQSLAQREAELKVCENRMYETTSRLELEIQEKQEIRGRDAINGLSGQIVALEETGQNLVMQLEGAKKSEMATRRGAADRSVQMEQQNATLQSLLEDVESRLATAQKDSSAARQSSKQDISNLKQQLDESRESLGRETTSLKTAVSQKNAAIGEIRQKFDTCVEDAERARNEHSLALHNQKTSMQREISSLRQKYEAVCEELSRAVGELEQYRAQASGKDKEVGKLHRDVQELQRRLRGQVDLLSENAGNLVESTTNTSTKQRRGSTEPFRDSAPIKVIGIPDDSFYRSK